MTSPEQLIIGGAFTDPAEVERMRLAMIRHPTNDGGYVHWDAAVHAWQYVAPRPKPIARRYHPSIVAHRPR